VKLSQDEKASLIKILRRQIESDTDVLKDHDSFSHGDWLRFENDVKNSKAILKKMRAPK
jgi:hypothetical protein